MRSIMAAQVKVFQLIPFTITFNTSAALSNSNHTATSQLHQTGERDLGFHAFGVSKMSSN